MTIQDGARLRRRDRPSVCDVCGARMPVTREDWDYRRLGVTVVLRDVEVYRCPRGHMESAVRNTEALDACVLRAVTTKPEKLESHEIRFLRRRLGWKAYELGDRMGVSNVTVSRWENGARVMSTPHERLLRLIVCQVIGFPGLDVPDSMATWAGDSDGTRDLYELRETPEGWTLVVPI